MIAEGIQEDTKMENKKNLQELRKEIDVVDQELVAQFEKRMELCAQIAAGPGAQRIQ